MFKTTEPHNDEISNKKKTLRVGKTVPEGAVGLAYYNNNPVNVDQNIAISKAPKVTIDHMTAEHSINKYCLPEKNSSYFPITYSYSDPNGYEGALSLDHVVWTDHLHRLSKFHTEKREFIVEAMIIPEKTIKIDMDGYTGTLGVSKVNYVPIEYESVSESTSETIQVRRTYRTGTLSSPDYTFPESLDYNSGGYVGKMYPVGHTKRFIPTMQDSTVVQHMESRYTDSASITVNIGGKNVTVPRIKRENESKNLKGFGICRVWSSNTTGNYNGHANRWTESFPNPKFRTDSYENRWCPNQFRSVNAILPSSRQDLKYTSSALGLTWGGSGTAKFWRPGSKNDEEWTIDWDKTRSYFSNNNTGWNWADVISLSDLEKWCGMTTQELAQYMEVTSIKPDVISGTTIQYSQVSYEKQGGTAIGPGDSSGMRKLYSTYWHKPTGKTCNNIVSTLGSYVTRRGATSSAANIYFRDMIQFYKGIKKIIKSTYATNAVTAGSISYKGEQDYEGVATKVGSDSTQKPIKWRAEVEYSGTLQKMYTDYNGIAQYSGVVTKRDSIGNINPTGSNVRIMYPNDAGYLHEDIEVLSSSTIESELFYVTNMFKDGTPLFYKYRLKEKVYDATGSNPMGLGSSVSVALVGARKRNLPANYKYAIKLIPTDTENVYYCDVYTSFVTSSSNSVKAIYISYDENSLQNKIKPNTEEEIFVKPCMVRGSDFETELVDSFERKNRIKITDPIIIPDTRRFVDVEYKLVVKNAAGGVVGETTPLTKRCLNHRYALSKESSLFVGRAFIASPKIKGRFKTAAEMVKEELNITDNDLKNCTIYAELINTSSDYYSVNLFVNPMGEEYVLAEIIADTGFYKDEAYDHLIEVPGKYVYSDGFIRGAYAVKCLDAREICLSQPKEAGLLDDWHVDVQFGHSTVVMSYRGVKKKFIYDIPEYDYQLYGKYGRPYKDITDEKAEFINENTIKIQRTPMYVMENISGDISNVTVKIKEFDGASRKIKVRDVNFNDGTIYLDEVISATDDIYVSYTYEENFYTYRGFFKDNSFIKLDLNTNMYHTFTNTDKSESTISKSTELFNKTIYFFLKPAAIINDFTGDGEVEALSKTAFSTLKNTENSFPATVFAQEDGYEGDIPKFGDPYSYEDLDSTETRVFQRVLRGKSDFSFPNEVEIDEDGFTGSIPKFGPLKHVSGTKVEERQEEVEEVKTGDHKYTFPQTITVNSNGTTGTLNKFGEKYLLSGEEARAESREFTDSILGGVNEEFPESVAINAGEFKGTIGKDGAPVLISGNEASFEELELEYSEERDTNNFPNSVTISTEEGTFEYLKDGEAIVISGQEGREETKELTDFIESRDKESFPSSITRTSEEGIQVHCDKDGEPIHVSGEDKTELVTHRVNYKTEAEIPKTITIDYNGKQETLPLYGVRREIIGYEQKPTGKGEIKDFEVGRFYIYKEFDGNTSDNVVIGKTIWTPNLDNPKQCSGCPDTLTVARYGDVTLPSPHIPINSQSDRGPKTFKKSDLVYAREIRGVPYPPSLASHIIVRDEKKMQDVQDKIGPNGGYILVERETDYVHLNPGEFFGPEIARSAISYKGDPLHTIGLEYIYSIVARLEKVEYEDDLGKPIYGDYIATFKGEVVVSKALWRQNYKGTYQISIPDTRVWRQNYKYTLTVETPDTRVFEQRYKGTLSINIPDTRVFGQLYKGTITYPATDNRVFEQSYRGELVRFANSRTFQRHIDSQTSTNFPDTFAINEDGFVGDIPKFGEPEPLNGGTSFRQNYKGTLTKEVTSNIVWKQDYKGLIYKKPNASKDSKDSASQTEVVFVIDKNENLKEFHDSIIKQVSRIYNSLKASGLTTVKFGLATYGNEKYSNVSFSTGMYTQNLQEFVQKVKEIAFNTTRSSTFVALKGIMGSYSFATDSRNVVLVSNSAATDTGVMFDVIEMANSKNIALHVVTDTIDEGVRPLVLTANDSNGYVGDISTTWGIHISLGIGTVCKLGVVKVINKSTVYHKINDDVPDEKEDLLIGTIFVRPTATFQSTLLKDVRNLGGGILETMSDNIRRELEPESDFYLDIGYFDGEPYSENSVVIIRVDNSILKENGGNFSRKDVENAVNKWIAAGTMPLIEYVETGSSIESFGESVEVVKVVENKSSIKPDIKLI